LLDGRDVTRQRARIMERLMNTCLLDARFEVTRS
jgi:hypothetical protein